MKKALKALEWKGKNALRSLLVPGAIRALKAAARDLNSVDQAVKLADTFSFLRIQIAPAQVPSEITGLLNLLASRKPRTVLEIGAYKGGTFFLFSRVAASDALLINLDLPPQPSHHGTLPWRARLYRSFARDRQKIELVAGDSHEPSALQAVKHALNGREVDFLFIDGDHSYAGVKADFAMYSPLVANDGLIAFHDIVPAPPERRFGVAQFWQEVKRTRRATEFVADWSQGGFGIGVLTKEETPKSNP